MRLARYTVPLVGLPLLAVLASSSYAAWSMSASGTAAAASGAAVPLTTSAVAVTTGLLYPDGPAGDVRMTVVNPNAFPVRITQVAGTGTVTGSGGTGTCAVTGVSFTTQNGTYDVAANASATFTFAGAATMSAAAENGCQDATFTIGVTLTGASN